ncbi:MAG TPA: rhomboid family intramembrane serine protease [Burkholderiaceae bacterium]|nr:rhomboid family intramembrane serine protease [Burkholderiaceae bacterium]
MLHFPVPDPAYTHTAQSRAHFRLAVRLACGFVALLWLIQLMNWGFGVDPDPFGVRPRETAGIAGIFFAPLVHAGFMHLIANTLPLIVLGSAMLFLYPQSALRALPVIYLAPGLVVWLFGRSSVHLGASGLIYGLAAYVFIAGLLRRDRRAIAASLIVSFMYGSLALGFLPMPPEISWETHLAAAVLGVLLALLFRRLDVAPPKRYGWDEEAGAPAPAEDEGARADPLTHPTPDTSETDRHR